MGLRWEKETAVMGTQKVILADTNIISFWIKGMPIGRQYKILATDKEVRISLVTLGEVLFGSERRHWGKARRQRALNFLRKFSVMPTAPDIARIYAEIRDQRASIGRPLESSDAWIAATAMWYDIPLMTHDADFFGIPGLQIITLMDRPRIEEFEPTIKGERIREPGSSCVGRA